MNITLSADAKMIERTRDYARRHGTSVNQLVRDFLESLTEQEARDRVADEFTQNATAHAGHSAEGFLFCREDAQRTKG